MVNCGLLTNKNEPVPLKSIEVNLQVQGHVATVSSTLQYVNEEQGPVEALFVFPMPADAAVCHFSAKIADQEVVAEVQEKEKARDMYDDAVSSGDQAFLLEESEESVDVFRLSVGSLPPGQSAAVTFAYVTELSVQADHALRFCLPGVLNPRYSPPGTSGGIVSEITPGSAQIPYSLSFTAHFNSPNPIAKVESKCALEPMEFLNADHTQAKVSLCAGHKFDRDVELFLYYQNAHQPTAIVEAGVSTAQPGSLMGDPVIMLSLYPEFPEAVTSTVSSCGEFVFVMDRSGSMSCPMHNGPNSDERIKSSRDTLLLLLKSLPIGCYFNIYGFGSHYESFFPKSVEYSQETMDQAVQRVKQMQADMGGTEILQPLKHIYSQPCIPNHPRQVFIFTDGEVGNTKDVLQLVRSNANSHRCFSFGIGEGASTALITGVAREGSGHEQFITGTDRMQPKVMQSLRYALQPAVTDIAEVWSVPEGMSTTLLSSPVKVLFNGQRALIYAQLKGEACKSSDSKGTITVQYRLGDQHVSNTLNFSLKPADNTGLTIHRLAARSQIRSLEQEQQTEGDGKEDLRTRVVDLSVQAGVSSSHTAFVAVCKGSGEALKGPLLRRRIPMRAPMACMGVMRMGAMPQCKFRKTMPMSCMIQKMPQARFRSAQSNRCVMAPMHMGSMPQTSLALGSTSMQYASLETGGVCQDAVPLKSQSTPNKFSRWLQGRARQITTKGGKPFKDKSTLLMGVDYARLVPQDIPTSVRFWSLDCDSDPLLQLISLQEASGCWKMESTLAQVFGKNIEEVTKQMPAEVEPGIWATVLALIWLHGFKMDAHVEWQFVAMKAVSWIRSKNVANLSECVLAANAVLQCKVKEEALGF